MDNNSELILDNLKKILGDASILLFNAETVSFLRNFDSLPKDKQLELFNIFLNSLKFYKSIEEEKSNRQLCEKVGHIYSHWYEDVSFENYRGASFKNKIWCKKCKRCGNVEITFVKPNELGKLENNQDKITVLKKKFVK